jgi:hypothetical protein
VGEARERTCSFELIDEIAYQLAASGWLLVRCLGQLLELV